MLYPNARAWRDAPRKRVMVFGMSGLGKTYLANILRAEGEWFHYSIDYRIGTRYMGEYIIDNAKAQAMQVPFLRELLMSDSIYIGSNITFDNLSPVSTYLGKPGDVQKGGLDIDEYRRRQDQFRVSEISALNDTGYFIERSERLYGYPNFICDTGGSICEWVEAENPEDPLMAHLSQHCLPVWIRNDEAHVAALVERFDRAPKPMAYQPAFLSECWTAYLGEKDVSPERVDPDDFVRWTYAQALAHRAPRYEAMARWGVTITPAQISELRGAGDFEDLIAQTLP